MPPTSYHIDPPMPVYCLTGGELSRPCGTTFSAQRYDPLRSVPRNAPRPPLPPSPPSSFPLEVLPAAHNAPNDHANINAPSQTADIFTAIAIKADDESSASEVKLDVLDLGSVPAFVPSLSLASQDEENANLRQHVSAKKLRGLYSGIAIYARRASYNIAWVLDGMWTSTQNGFRRLSACAMSIVNTSKNKAGNII